jgi:hypothetical protein
MKTFEFIIFETVDAAEHQRCIAEIEVGQALHQRIVNCVTFKSVLKSSAHAGFGVTAKL